jgi:phosphate transport system substrate-binding protein
LQACQLAEDTTRKDSPTSGNIKLFADEGLTLHLNNQVFTFKQIYKYADIQVNYTSESAAIEALYKDSCKVIAINRDLSETELKKFKSINLYPERIPVAYNAITVITNNETPDSLLNIDSLVSLLKGVSKKFNIVFDNNGSGSMTFLKDSLLKGAALGTNCSAAKNTKDLINYISNNKSCIGLLDYAWLSDKDDLTTQDFLKKVKIIPISKHNGERAYFPDQSNIATKDYPLCRVIYMMRRSADFSLGAGIITFVAGEKGQLMFLKQGLPPHRQEERVIEIDMTPIGTK